MTVKYTEEHEWIQLEDHEAAVVGITLHAQDALGDVGFVDLPEVGRNFAKVQVACAVEPWEGAWGDGVFVDLREVGRNFAKGEVAGVVESVKAAADIFMPVAGEVTEVN